MSLMQDFIDAANLIECPVIREKYLKNLSEEYISGYDPPTRLDDAIHDGFSWSESDEDWDFWNDVHTLYLKGETPFLSEHGVLTTERPAPKEPRVSGLAKFMNKIESNENN